MPPSLKPTVAYRPAQRVVTRFAAVFVVRCARTIAHPSLRHDHRLGLMLLAVWQASRFRPRDPKPAKAGTPGVSIRALAASMDVPYETARRDLNALVELGFCTYTASDGFTVANARKACELFEHLNNELGNHLLKMLRELRDVGFDFDVLDRDTDSEPLPDEPALCEASAVGDGVIARETLDQMAIDLFLRFVDIGTQAHGRNFGQALVFTAMMVMNAEGITSDRAVAWQYSQAETPPPDDMRKPVTIHTMARELGIPYETTRRHVNALVRAGACANVGRAGFIIPVQSLQKPEVLASGAMLTLRFGQALLELKRYGFDLALLGKSA